MDKGSITIQLAIFSAVGAEQDLELIIGLNEIVDLLLHRLTVTLDGNSAGCPPRLQQVDANALNGAIDNIAGAGDIESINGEPVCREDGAISADGTVWGTYLHGLFDGTEFRRSFLKRLGPNIAGPEGCVANESMTSFKDGQYNLLAQHFEDHLDMEKLLTIAGLAGK